MSNATSLKEQNAWLIRAVLLLHAIAFAYVAFEPFVLVQNGRPDVLQKLREALAPGTISLVAIALARIVLLGLVPSGLRDRLIHWRWRHPLPGARAFTKFGPADPRVDMSKLEKIYGPLPTDPDQQGALFYRIYSTNATRVGVLDAHKSYLAVRDIGTINFVLFVLLPPSAFWAIDDVVRPGVYAVTLFLSYVLTSLAAQVYGARLVENTLAAASGS
jgi:hypothetical protein